ncbi:MAG: hypothetical protein WCJ30_19630 [Deltaproteobacteria bacterium]
MKHRTAMRALALGLVLIGTTAGHASFAQRRAHRAARAPSSQCVRFSREAAADGRTITFEIGNECTTAVEATVSWSLVCGASGNTGPEERRESLQPGTRRVISASTEACGERDYRIDGVRWSWRRAGEGENP